MSAANERRWQSFNVLILPPEENMSERVRCGLGLPMISLQGSDDHDNIWKEHKVYFKYCVELDRRYLYQGTECSGSIFLSIYEAHGARMRLTSDIRRDATEPGSLVLSCPFCA